MKLHIENSLEMFSDYYIIIINPSELIIKEINRLNKIFNILLTTFLIFHISKS